MTTMARPWVHILTAGTFTDMHGNPVTFTAGDLSAIAANYRPDLHPAPVVLGHPVTNGPAFGWISAFAAYRGELEAELDRLDPAFIAAVKTGRYATRSISLYPPDHPSNPRPGAYYPRHLGFLGAAPPAVKGLRPAELAGAFCELASPEVIRPMTQLEQMEANKNRWRHYWRNQPPELRQVVTPAEEQAYWDHYDSEHPDQDPAFWERLGIRPYR